MRDGWRVFLKEFHTKKTKNKFLNQKVQMTMRQSTLHWVGSQLCHQRLVPNHVDSIKISLSLSLFSFKLLILLCFEVLVQCVRYSMLSGAPLWCSVCLTFCEVLKGLMPPEKMTPNSQLMNGLAGYLLLSFLVSIFLAMFYFASDWK